MKFKGTLADPIFIGCAIYASFYHSPFWLLVIPMIAGSWFFGPRWDKQDGWRMWH